MKTDLLKGILGLLLGLLGMTLVMGGVIGAHYFLSIATGELPPSYYLHRGMLVSLLGMPLLVWGICLTSGSPEPVKS